MQLVRLRASWAKPDSTNSPAHSMATASRPHPSVDFAPSVWGRMVGTCSSCLPALLPLPEYPLGTHLSTEPKHRLSTAGARAFGNCTPRLSNSLTANHPAKCRLQHFSLLKHVRQCSWYLCPLELTALCQCRRGKAVL